MARKILLTRNNSPWYKQTLPKLKLQQIKMKNTSWEDKVFNKVLWVGFFELECCLMFFLVDMLLKMLLFIPSHWFLTVEVVGKVNMDVEASSFHHKCTLQQVVSKHGVPVSKHAKKRKSHCAFNKGCIDTCFDTKSFYDARYRTLFRYRLTMIQNLTDSNGRLIKCLKIVVGD